MDLFRAIRFTSCCGSSYWEQSSTNYHPGTFCVLFNVVCASWDCFGLRINKIGYFSKLHHFCVFLLLWCCMLYSFSYSFSMQLVMTWKYIHCIKVSVIMDECGLILKAYLIKWYGCLLYTRVLISICISILVVVNGNLNIGRGFSPGLSSFCFEVYFKG